MWWNTDVLFEMLRGENAKGTSNRRVGRCRREFGTLTLSPIVAAAPLYPREPNWSSPKHRTSLSMWRAHTWERPTDTARTAAPEPRGSGARDGE